MQIVKWFRNTDEDTRAFVVTTLIAANIFLWVIPGLYVLGLGLAVLTAYLSYDDYRNFAF